MSGDDGDDGDEEGGLEDEEAPLAPHHLFPGLLPVDLDDVADADGAPDDASPPGEGMEEPPPADRSASPGGSADHSNVILLPGLQFARPAAASAASFFDEPGLEPPRRPHLALPPDDDDGIERLDPGGPPPAHQMEPAVEALLLAADGPVTEEQLNTWLDDPGPRRVREALHALQRRWRQADHGIQLVQVAKGWQLRTDPRFARWVAAMRGGKPVRLSRAALETIAVIAYRQPITRTEIEELRGVDSGGVLRMLSERQLVETVGRRDEPGRPLVYGTTPEFLALFGLRDLSDLPTLRDLRELSHDVDEGPGAGSPPQPKPPQRPPDLPDLD